MDDSPSSQASYQLSNSPHPLNISWEPKDGFMEFTFEHNGNVGIQIIDSHGRATEQVGFTGTSAKLIQYPHGPKAYAPEPLLFAPETEISLTAEMLSEMNLVGLGMMSEKAGFQVSTKENSTRIQFPCQQYCAKYNDEIVDGDFLIEEGEIFPKTVIYPHGELELQLISAGVPDMNSIDSFQGWPSIEETCPTFCLTEEIHPALDLQAAHDFLTATDPIHEESKFGFIFGAMIGNQGTWTQSIQDDANQDWNRQAMLLVQDEQVVPIPSPVAAAIEQKFFESPLPRVPYDLPWKNMNFENSLYYVASVNVDLGHSPNQTLAQVYRYIAENEHEKITFLASEATGHPLFALISKNEDSQASALPMVYTSEGPILPTFPFKLQGP